MLNDMQKVVLNTTFSFIFDSLREGIPQDVSLKAIEAIFDDALFESGKAIWIQHQIAEIIQQAQKIVKHPYPQNRAEGNPYVRNVPPGKVAYVVYKDDGTKTILYEDEGLLSLTAYHNREQGEAVTRDDVVNYLREAARRCSDDLQLTLVSNVATTTTTTVPTLAIPSLPADIVLTYTVAVGKFVDALSEELMKPEWRKLPLDPQAHIAYATTVLQQIRKKLLNDLWANPESFAIPKALVGFIQSYIEQNPILRTGEQLTANSRELETRYINKNNATTTTTTTTQFFAPAQSHNTNLITFRQAVLDLVDALQVELSQHRHLNLDPHAHLTFVASLLNAIRKERVSEFLENKENKEVPDLVASFFKIKWQSTLTLHADKTLFDSVKRIEVQLNNNQLEALRQDCIAANSVSNINTQFA